MGRGTVALAALSIIGSSAPARAEVDRVVLIDLPAELSHAVTTAIEPWDVAVVELDGPTPGAAMPSAAVKASDAAAVHGAGAVVWLASDGSGTALWVFDLQSERTTARRLGAAPPYDEAAAASVALSVKTLLRFSAVAPVTERYDAPPAAPPAPATPPAAPRRVRLGLGVAGGVRHRPSDGGGLEPRVAVGGRAVVAGLADGIVIGLDLGLGGGEAVDGPFVGRFAETSLAARVGLTLPVGARLAAVPAIGGSVRWTSLDGAVPGASGGVSIDRLNSTIDAGLALTTGRSGGLAVGVEGMAAYALERQRYLVGDQVVLELPPLDLEIAVIARLILP